MTYEDIYELGWRYEYESPPMGIVRMGNESFFMELHDEYWIMGIYLERDGTYNVMINYVDESVDHNEWENSHTYFYGRIRNKEDLNMIMQFVGINELL